MNLIFCFQSLLKKNKHLYNAVSQQLLFIGVYENIQIHCKKMNNFAYFPRDSKLSQNSFAGNFEIIMSSTFMSIPLFKQSFVLDVSDHLKAKSQLMKRFLLMIDY